MAFVLDPGGERDEVPVAKSNDESKRGEPLISLAEKSVSKQATRSMLELLQGSLLESLKSAVLESIAYALVQEAERLERISERPDGKIDFYDEVRNFECNLIERAIILAGNQRRAAQMLGLNTTTLNAKIKSYNIQTRAFPHAHGRSSANKPARTKD